MKRRINKKSMLGMLTAAAIVATVAGSYAVWDTLEATGTAKLTLDKPVVATMTIGSDFALEGGARTLGGNGTYTSSVTFSVADAGDRNLQATLVPAVKNAGTDCTSDFDIKILDGDTELTDNVDTTITATNSYTVKITPKDSAATLAGTELEVSLTGTLAEQPSA